MFWLTTSMASFGKTKKLKNFNATTVFNAVGGGWLRQKFPLHCMFDDRKNSHSYVNCSNIDFFSFFGFPFNHLSSILMSFSADTPNRAGQLTLF